MSIIASQIQNVNNPLINSENPYKNVKTSGGGPYNGRCGLPEWSQLYHHHRRTDANKKYTTAPIEWRLPFRVVGFEWDETRQPMFNMNGEVMGKRSDTRDRKDCMKYRSLRVNYQAQDMVVLRLHGYGYKDIHSVGHIGYIRDLGLPTPNYISVLEYGNPDDIFDSDTVTEMVWVLDDPLNFNEPKLKELLEYVNDTARLLRYFGLAVTVMDTEAINWTLPPESGVWQYRMRDYAYSSSHLISLLREAKYQMSWGAFRRNLQRRLQRELRKRPKMSEKKLENFALRAAKEMLRRNRIPLPGLERTKLGQKLTIVNDRTSKRPPSLIFPKGFDEKYGVYPVIRIVVQGPFFQEVMRTARAVSNYSWHNRTADPLPNPRNGRSGVIEDVSPPAKDYYLDGVRITPEMRKKAGDNPASRMALVLGREKIAKRKENNKKMTLILHECYFTAKDIAEFLGVTVRTVRRYLAETKAESKEPGRDLDSIMADTDVDKMIIHALDQEKIDIVPYEYAPAHDFSFSDVPRYVKNIWNNSARMRRRCISFDILNALRFTRCSYYEWLQDFDKSKKNPPYGIVLYTLLQYRAEKYGDVIPYIFHYPRYTLENHRLKMADFLTLHSKPTRRVFDDPPPRILPPDPFAYDVSDDLYEFQLSFYEREADGYILTPEYVTAKLEQFEALGDLDKKMFLTPEEEDEYILQLQKDFEAREEELRQFRMDGERMMWHKLYLEERKFWRTRNQNPTGF